MPYTETVRGVNWVYDEDDISDIVSGGAALARTVQRRDNVYCPFPMFFSPYGTCTNKCVYCYALTFGRSERTRARDLKRAYSPAAAIKNFKYLLESRDPHTYKFLIRKVPVELSVNTDPFQAGLEIKYGVSLRFLRFLNEIQYPFVLISKSTDVMERPEYQREILRAHDDGKRVFLKISFSTFNDALAKVLEPDVPSVTQRLGFIKRMRERGVGCILRMEPLILGHTFESFLPRKQEIADTGVQRVLTGPLRTNEVAMDMYYYRIFAALGYRSYKEYYAKYGDKIEPKYGGRCALEYDFNVLRECFSQMKQTLNELDIKFSVSGLHYGLPHADLCDMQRHCCELPGYEHLQLDNEALVIRWCEKRLGELSLNVKDRTEWQMEILRAEVVNDPAFKPFIPERR